MTARQLRLELAGRAGRLAGNVPRWALDEAAQKIVSAITMARLGSAIDAELGDFDPVELWDMGDEAAALARDSPRWPQYRDRALARRRELSHWHRLRIPRN